MSQHEPSSPAQRPPMPSILGYDSPEQYSEALKSAGYLDERTEGVLTDSDGVLGRAHYRNGQLEFDDPARTLTSLYEQRRSLRADAVEHFQLLTSLRSKETNAGSDAAGGDADHSPGADDDDHSQESGLV